MQVEMWSAAVLDPRDDPIRGGELRRSGLAIRLQQAGL